MYSGEISDCQTKKTPLHKIKDRRGEIKRERVQVYVYTSLGFFNKRVESHTKTFLFLQDRFIIDTN